jgi:hypothetical protein
MLSEMPQHLLHLVLRAEPLFAAFDPSLWTASRGPGKWTRLELLGHLIDSAANNHQRFVRGLAQPLLDWPGYDQIAHVSVQRYAAAEPGVCVALWAAYNRHIAHVMRGIVGPKVSTPCAIDGAPEMSLEDLALDYVAHLEHHLRQLLEGVDLGYSGMPWPPADPNRQWPV